MAEHDAPAPGVRLEEWFRRDVKEKAEEAVGGRARLRVIVVLACVLGLDAADKATVGALAVELKQALGLGNLQLALLVAGSTLMTALATLPFGVLTDRINRTNLLAGGVVVWAALMVVGGISNSYLMLLLSRLALGAAIAVAVPVVASLTGDYFQPGERARVWGYILAGELVGAAFGYLVAGNIAALFSWRASFWALAALSLLLAPLVWWLLPEPARGGQSRLAPGASKIVSAEQVDNGGRAEQPADSDNVNNEIEEAVAERGIPPHESLILREDPRGMSFRRAGRYVLSIRTNVVLITASALGYFFFAGLLTFAVVFLRGRFGLGQGAATTLGVGLGAGAIIGVVFAGRAADWLIEHGRINARIWVSATAFLLAAALFLPALLTTSLYIAAPLFFLAAVALGGTNSPLDAARLDIMHFGLWGRAESIRAALRYAFQAIAPLVFAGITILLGAGGGMLGIGGGQAKQSASALAQTFMIMLIPLAVAGLILFLAVRTYPRDVATARASEDAGQSPSSGRR